MKKIMRWKVKQCPICFSIKDHRCGEYQVDTDHQKRIQAAAYNYELNKIFCYYHGKENCNSDHHLVVKQCPKCNSKQNHCCLLDNNIAVCVDTYHYDRTMQCAAAYNRFEPICDFCELPKSLCTSCDDYLKEKQRLKESNSFMQNIYLF